MTKDAGDCRVESSYTHIRTTTDKKPKSDEKDKSSTPVGPMSTSPKQRKNAHLKLASVGAHMYVMTRRKRKRREIDGKKPRTHVLASARHTHYVRGKDWKLRCDNDDEVEEEGSGGGGESQGDGRAHPSRPKKEQGPWLAHGSHLSVSVEEEKPVSQLRRPSEAARQLDTQCSLDGMLAASCEYES